MTSMEEKIKLNKLNDLPMDIRSQMKLVMGDLTTKESIEIDSVVSLSVYEYLEVTLLPDFSENTLRPVPSAHLFVEHWKDDQEKYMNELIKDSFNTPGMDIAFDFKSYKIIADNKKDNIIGILVKSNTSGMKFLLVEKLTLDKEEDMTCIRLSFAKLLKFMTANKIR